ncbi:hypothetical protein FQR65_LT14914 [Abscondita terminalis]|nr:hypothetical protein FQR65_LT14914 [Abscondita terminalis]
MAENETELQKNLEIWNSLIEKNEMTINKNKIKVVEIGGEEKDFEMRIGETKIRKSLILQAKAMITLNFCWTKSHLGTAGTDRVDQMAKKKTVTADDIKTEYANIPKYAIKRLVRKRTEIQRPGVIRSTERALGTFCSAVQHRGTANTNVD